MIRSIFLLGVGVLAGYAYAKAMFECSTSAGGFSCHLNRPVEQIIDDLKPRTELLPDARRQSWQEPYQVLPARYQANGNPVPLHGQ